MQTNYITKQGDCWDSIARVQLGSERHMQALMNANPQHAGVVVFSAGIALALPPVQAEQSSVALTPPWRR